MTHASKRKGGMTSKRDVYQIIEQLTPTDATAI